MRMSIDEAYNILAGGLVRAKSEKEWCMAFRIALDTMQKYQKLQKSLREVIKDGENNY
jgi:hypothetical protein